MTPAPDPDTLALDLAAEPLAIRDALSLVIESGPVVRLAAEDRATIELVLAEVLNNIAEHAYRGQGGQIELWISRDRTGLQCKVQDHGCPMPGLRLPVGRLPDHMDGLADLPEGGFGWHLIRSLTDRLTYRRDDGRNSLSFTFHITQ